MTDERNDARAEIAIIGGTGLYSLPGLTEVDRVTVDTPYGPTSSPIVLGVLGGRRVAFLARHGEGHTLLPAELPVRANMWALKSLGVGRVLSISAVGSLRVDFEPLHAVVPDQLIDRTRGRASTFFGDGLVAHVGLADPFCLATSEVLGAAAEATDVRVHRGATLVVIDGPAFSTRAESQLFRSWGADIIGMTALPEARLAREAELCYAALCFVTDYDVWHEDEPDVDAGSVIERLRANAQSAVTALAQAIEALPSERDCACAHALDTALVTPRDRVPPETLRRLAPLLASRWGEA